MYVYNRLDCSVYIPYQSIVKHFAPSINIICTVPWSIIIVYDLCIHEVQSYCLSIHYNWMLLLRIYAEIDVKK